MKPTWIDTHIHISDYGTDGVKRDNFCQALGDLLDSSDADLKFVVSADCDYNFRILKDSSYILKCNRFVHEVCQEFPGRVFGSCLITPNAYEESLETMNICFGEWGFVMLGEMLGYMMHFNLTDENSLKLVRRATEFDVPIQVHLGTYVTMKGYAPNNSMDGIAQIADMIRCADTVPNAKWIMAHAIGCAPFRHYIPWANMFLDIVQGHYGCFPENFWVEIRDFYCKALPRVIQEVPHDKILSGTDWTTRIGPPFAPYGTCFEATQGQETPYVPCVATFIDYLKKAGATDEVIELVAHKNAEKLFKL